MLPVYQIRFLHEPPFTVRFGRDVWHVSYDLHGKNGKRATFSAKTSDGRVILILDGRERSVAHEVASLTSSPGTILHELWVRLAHRGAVQLVEITPRPRPPAGRCLDCGGNLYVPLPQRGRHLTHREAEALCARARGSVAPGVAAFNQARDEQRAARRRCA